MGSSAQESLVLRWNDFQSNIANCFVDLRAEQDFFDVTLAIDEDHQIQAHKVILAASSSFFKSMLKKVIHTQHPVLVMPPNIKILELNYIIEFIYHGVVTVPNEDLNNLMKLANLLKIKGLVEEKPPSSRHQQQQQQHKSPNVPASKMNPQPSRKRPDPIPPSASPLKSAKKSKTPFDMKSTPQKNLNLHDGEGGEGHFEGGDYDEQDFDPAHQPSTSSASQNYPPVPPIPSSSAGPISDATSSAAAAAAAAATALSGTRLVALKCPQCFKIIPGPEAFKLHMASFHGRGQDQPPPPPAAIMGVVQPKEENEGKMSTCEICDKKFKNKRYVVAHQKRIHKMGINPLRRGGANVGAPGESSSPHHPFIQGGEAKKRGRPKKKLDEEEHEVEHHHQGEETYGGTGDEPTAQPAKTPCSSPKPIGQVHPTSRAALSQDNAAGTSSGGRAHGMGRSNSEEPRPGPSVPRGPMRQQNRPPPPPPPHPPSASPSNRGGRNMSGSSSSGPSSSAGPPNVDLKRSLGLKFGGHISITSSDQGPRGRGPNDPQGFSITKMKGESSGSQMRQQHRQQQQESQQQQIPVEVKQEPVDEEEFGEEEDEETYEDYEEYDEGAYEDEMYEGEGTTGMEGYVDDGYGIENEEEELGEEEEEEDFGEIPKP